MSNLTQVLMVPEIHELDPYLLPHLVFEPGGETVHIASLTAKPQVGHYVRPFKSNEWYFINTISHPSDGPVELVVDKVDMTLVEPMFVETVVKGDLTHHASSAQLLYSQVPKTSLSVLAVHFVQNVKNGPFRCHIHTVKTRQLMAMLNGMRQLVS